MTSRRENRSSKASLFDDGLEEGGLRASSSYSSDISEHDNDKAIDTLKDRVFFLKQLSGDIRDEVIGHNRLLDQMGSGMDASRGILSGTVNRFKMVFEKKSGRTMCKLVGFLVALFMLLYFLISSVEALEMIAGITDESGIRFEESRVLHLDTDISDVQASQVMGTTDIHQSWKQLLPQLLYL